MSKKSINKLVKQDLAAVRKACKKQIATASKHASYDMMYGVEDALIKTFNDKTMKQIALMECVEAKVEENAIGQIKVSFVFSNDKCVKKMEKQLQMMESDMALRLSGLSRKKMASC